MWTEEYRPKNLDSVIGQDKNIKFIKQFVNDKDIPHMLFAGPAGTGKTSTAIALSKELYGEDWNRYFMELNASDERGINTVRKKIKEYAEAKTIDVEFKILFLDEVDNLTNDAQNALRRIIETNDSICKFILSCNHPNKLIEPLINRCMFFRFAPVSTNDVKKFIEQVSKDKNIDISPSGIDALAEISKGSMRTPLKILEKLKRGNVQKIDKKIIYYYTNRITDEDMKMLLSLIEKKSSVSQIDNFIDNMILDKGYTAVEVIEKIREFIKNSNLISISDKLQALKTAGEIEYRISIGSNPQIQLKTYFVYLMILFRGGK